MSRRLKYGRIAKAACKTPDGKIHTGWRHAYIRDDIRELGYSIEDCRRSLHDPWSCGFVTEDGTFLTRKQALSYGRYIGQIDKLIGGILTSEDLWDNEGNPIEE